MVFMQIVQKLGKQVAVVGVTKYIQTGITCSFFRSSGHIRNIDQKVIQKRCYSNTTASHDIPRETEPQIKLPPTSKRKSKRTPAGKSSLRSVAAEAQRSREKTQRGKLANVERNENNRIIATSVADQFDMEAVTRILRSHGFQIDPDCTDFDTDQVVHTRGVNNGDIFVFPSGSLVAWSLPEDVVFDLATKTLLPAALNPHMDQMEMEDLEYLEEPKRENSSIRADIITIGTKQTSHGEQLEK